MWRTWWSAGAVYKLCISGTEPGSEGEEQTPRLGMHAVQRHYSLPPLAVQLLAAWGTCIHDQRGRCVVLCAWRWRSACKIWALQ